MIKWIEEMSDWKILQNVLIHYTENRHYRVVPSEYRGWNVYNNETHEYLKSYETLGEAKAFVEGKLL